MNKPGKTFTGLPSLLLIGCTALALISVTPVKSHAQTQQQMNRQAAREAEVADAALNKAYQQLLSKLDKPAQAKLRSAQRAWIVFRDREATFAADFARGGTMAPLLYGVQRAEMTKARTKDLQDYYHSYRQR